MRASIAMCLVAMLSLGCAAEETSQAGAIQDAGASAGGEDAWWNVDVAAPGSEDTGGDAGAATDGGDGDSDCYQSCVNSGKATATPELCTEYCAGGGDDKGATDKGGSEGTGSDDTGSDDTGSDDKGAGDGGDDPATCYYLCVQAGGTTDSCETECGFGQADCLEGCVAKGGTQAQCDTACMGK
jgi:hypothetical protein